MRHRSSFLASASLLVVIAAIAPAQKPAPTPRSEVERTNDGLVAAFKSGKPDAAAALVTEDMVEVEKDGSRHEGRGAYMGSVRQVLSAFNVREFKPTIEEFGADGNLAWVAGKELGMFADKKTGKPTMFADQYLAVYQRQANGRYLMRYLMQTPAPGARK